MLTWDEYCKLLKGNDPCALVINQMLVTISLFTGGKYPFEEIFNDQCGLVEEKE